MLWRLKSWVEQFSSETRTSVITYESGIKPRSAAFSSGAVGMYVHTYSRAVRLVVGPRVSEGVAELGEGVCRDYPGGSRTEVDLHMIDR
jgi:hypothetical protein